MGANNDNYFGLIEFKNNNDYRKFINKLSE